MGGRGPFLPRRDFCRWGCLLSVLRQDGHHTPICILFTDAGKEVVGLRLAGDRPMHEVVKAVVQARQARAFVAISEAWTVTGPGATERIRPSQHPERRQGGKVIISLTSPYISRKKGQKDLTIIDESFILSLQTLRDKPGELKMQIAKLSAKKLRELGRLIGYPVRTKSARQEVVEELVRHFHGEEIWRRIAG